MVGRLRFAWLLVGSLATCYEVTLVEFARQQAVPLHDVRVRAAAEIGELLRDGYDLSALELDVELTTDPGRELDAEEVAMLARKHFVTRVLRVPVILRRVEVHVAQLGAPAHGDRG